MHISSKQNRKKKLLGLLKCATDRDMLSEDIDRIRAHQERAEQDISRAMQTRTGVLIFNDPILKDVLAVGHPRDPRVTEDSGPEHHLEWPPPVTSSEVVAGSVITGLDALNALPVGSVIEMYPPPLRNNSYTVKIMVATPYDKDTEKQFPHLWREAHYTGNIAGHGAVSTHFRGTKWKVMLVGDGVVHAEKIQNLVTSLKDLRREDNLAAAGKRKQMGAERVSSYTGKIKDIVITPEKIDKYIQEYKNLVSKLISAYEKYYYIATELNLFIDESKLLSAHKQEAKEWVHKTLPGTGKPSLKLPSRKAMPYISEIDALFIWKDEWALRRELKAWMKYDNPSGNAWEAKDLSYEYLGFELDEDKKDVRVQVSPSHSPAISSNISRSKPAPGVGSFGEGDFYNSIKEIESRIDELYSSIPNNIEELVAAVGLNSLKELEKYFFEATMYKESGYDAFKIDESLTEHVADPSGSFFRDRPLGSDGSVVSNYRISQGEGQSVTPLVVEKLLPSELISLDKKYKKINIVGLPPGSSSATIRREQERMRALGKDPTLLESNRFFDPDAMRDNPEEAQLNYRGGFYDALHTDIHTSVIQNFKNLYQTTNHEVLKAAREEIDKNVINNFNKYFDKIAKFFEIYKLDAGTVLDIKSKYLRKLETKFEVETHMDEESGWGAFQRGTASPITLDGEEYSMFPSTIVQRLAPSAHGGGDLNQHYGKLASEDADIMNILFSKTNLSDIIEEVDSSAINQLIDRFTKDKKNSTMPSGWSDPPNKQNSAVGYFYIESMKYIYNMISTNDIDAMIHNWIGKASRSHNLDENNLHPNSVILGRSIKDLVKGELVIDLPTIFKHIDKKLAQKIRNKGLNYVASDGINTTLKVWAGHSDDLINESELKNIIIEYLQSPLFSDQESQVGKALERKRQAIVLSRFATFGDSGYRNFKKSILGKFKYLDQSLIGQSPDADDIDKREAFRKFFIPAMLKLYSQEENYLFGKTDKLFNNFPIVEHEVDGKVVRNSWIEYLYANANLGRPRSQYTSEAFLSTPVYIVEKIFSDTSWPPPGSGGWPYLRRCIFKFSKAEEFNSPERMDKFIIELVNLYSIFSKDRDLWSLAKFYETIEPRLNDLTGNKKIKIRKILSLVHVLDNAGAAQDKMMSDIRKHMDSASDVLAPGEEPDRSGLGWYQDTYEQAFSRGLTRHGKFDPRKIVETKYINKLELNTVRQAVELFAELSKMFFLIKRDVYTQLGGISPGSHYDKEKPMIVYREGGRKWMFVENDRARVVLHGDEVISDPSLYGLPSHELLLPSGKPVPAPDQLQTGFADVPGIKRRALNHVKALKLFINNILQLRENLKHTLSAEDANKIVNKELVDFLRELDANDAMNSIDSFIEYLGANDISSAEKIVTVKEKIASLKYAVSIYSQMKGLLRYYKVAEKKDENLFLANLDGKNWRFRVLNYGDPYHFQVGKDVGCCQVLGGAGEAAAVDSFINKYAGVVLLEVNVKNAGWTLIAQSYFHYVPAKEGDDDTYFILDNIEADSGWNNAKIKEAAGYTLPDLYALLGQHLESNGAKKVLVGQAYSPIDTKDFKMIQLRKDPRTFKSEETYTDFDYRNGLSLLHPKFEISKKNIASEILEEKIRKYARIDEDIIFKLIGTEINKNTTNNKLNMLRKFFIKNLLLKESAMIGNLSLEINKQRAKEMEDLEQKYFSDYYAQDSEDILDDMQQPGAAGVVYVDDNSERVGGYLYGYQLVYEDEILDENIDLNDFECFDKECYEDLESFANEIMQKAKSGQIFYVSNFLIDKPYRLKINDFIFGLLDEVKNAGYKHIAFDALSDTYKLIMKNDKPNAAREKRYGIKVLGKINKEEPMFVARINELL